MHRGAAVLILAAPLLPTLACGGRVGSEGSGGGYDAGHVGGENFEGREAGPTQTNPTCPPIDMVWDGDPCPSDDLV
jgi:hypothetical protein